MVGFTILNTKFRVWVFFQGFFSPPSPPPPLGRRCRGSAWLRGGGGLPHFLDHLVCTLHLLGGGEGVRTDWGGSKKRSKFSFRWFLCFFWPFIVPPKVKWLFLADFLGPKFSATWAFLSLRFPDISFNFIVFEKFGENKLFLALEMAENG